ncbi:MAG: DUF4159 domain-containing protein [Chthoniobacterales bacterium]
MKIPHFNNPILQRIIERFSRSRDFTISFILHLLLVIIFGTTVVYKATQEPPDFEGGDSGSFVDQDKSNTPPPPDQPQETTQEFSVTTPVPNNAPPITAITTTSTTPLDFSMNTSVTPDMPKTPPKAVSSAAPTAATTAIGTSGMSVAAASNIKAFTGGWGKGSGSGQGLKQREFEFTAFLGQYAGGNWNSTVEGTHEPFTKGSLPNLLYYISKWSNGKIKTNERNVKAIKLDSDDLFTIKPPFIFMTGTRDFKLTDKEVENLRKYVQLGGAIWGDSSVPGLRSRFDIAFRREMRRVIPDKDKDFEALPKDHPIYTQNYYPEIRDVPAGMNYYKLPIYVLKIYGQIAIIYTANDYGDMWQFGLAEDPKTKKLVIDLRTNALEQHVAVNTYMWHIVCYGDYLHNVNAESLDPTYKFGTNIILHLLTRWEDQVSRAPKL